MKNILSRENRTLLKEFSASKVLLAFDFDGTLAPIVVDPERARMRARTRKLLLEIASLYPVAIISGRSQADASKRVCGLGVQEVVGNHGMEPWHASSHYVAEVQRWLPVLEAALAPFKGVIVEDKSYSLAVHYRASREKKKARAAILNVASKLGDVRIIGGKLVVNILPHGAPHKGIALQRARERLSCDTAIYVGDDETDEDVFVLDQPGRLLNIRVGWKRESAAAYYLAGQPQMDALLGVLIEQRRTSKRRSGGSS